MTVDRRALFDFALLLHRQLEQQEQQRQRQQRAADAAGSDETEQEDADTGGWSDSDDFVHVAHADAVGGAGPRLQMVQAAPIPRAAACMPQAAMVPKVRLLVRVHPACACQPFLVQ